MAREVIQIRQLSNLFLYFGNLENAISEPIQKMHNFERGHTKTIFGKYSERRQKKILLKRSLSRLCQKNWVEK